MTDKIIEAARKADPGFEGGPDADGTMADSLVGIEAVKRFYAIARAEALEDAAKKCESMAEDDLGNVGSQCFDCAEAIRKLKEQQHG